MARSRAKQGNRRNRVKLRNPDGSLKKDKRGRVMTMGLHATPLSDYKAQRWADERAERAYKAREAQAALEMEMSRR